jgi:excisionase family DNA binding protein
MQSETVQRWPAWQSTKVAAAYCGVSELVIRRAVASGALVAGRRGRLFTFKRADLDRWMRGGARRRRTHAHDRHAVGPFGAFGSPIIIQLAPPPTSAGAPTAPIAPTSAAERAAQRWGLTPDDGTEGEP